MYSVKKFLIAGKDGERSIEVSAFVNQSRRFAIHLDHLGMVIVSHFPSGMKIPGGPWKDFSRADRYCYRLNELDVNWNSERPEFSEDALLRFRELCLEYSSEA